MTRELKPSALWQPRGVGRAGRWERGSRGRGHTYTSGWFVLMYGRNQHNIVNNYPPIRNKLIFKIVCTLEKEVATHSSILAWEIPWAWWATVHGVSESDTTEPSEHPDARQGGAPACVVFLPGVHNPAWPAQEQQTHSQPVTSHHRGRREEPRRRGGDMDCSHPEGSWDRKRTWGNSWGNWVKSGPQLTVS